MDTTPVSSALVLPPVIVKNGLGLPLLDIPPVGMATEQPSFLQLYHGRLVHLPRCRVLQIGNGRFDAHPIPRANPRITARHLQLGLVYTIRARLPPDMDDERRM